MLFVCTINHLYNIDQCPPLNFVHAAAMVIQEKEMLENKHNHAVAVIAI
jgi:hypothetical protein